MNKIKTMGVVSKDMLKTHRVEVLVEFEEPITYSEAEYLVANAISKFLIKESEVVE